MAMTVTEANAVFRLLAWMCGTRVYAHGRPISTEEATTALVELAEAAGTKLQVSPGSEHISLAMARVGRALDTLEREGS